jgi:NADH-quinone oxidoreductase subunit H
MADLFVHQLVLPVAYILAIVVPLIVAVAMFVYWERKVIGWMHVRLGPTKIGPWGVLQAFADVFKLLFKEVILPAKANRFLYYLGPLIAVVPALAVWAVVPFDSRMVVSNANAGVLYLLAVNSIGVYGIIIAGWASNSRYALLGAMRSAAQVISYELATGFCLICVLILAGSLNITEIVNAQAGGKGLFEWFWLPLFPVFVIFFIAGVAETNRLPFDMAEGESEIVAGFHVEYSGSPFALFFLAEYANMILISFLSAIFFLGGWLSPVQGWVHLDAPGWINWLWTGGFVWVLIKAFLVSFLFLWFRATFPRYRYDQIMRLGWKIFIPISIAWLFVSGCMRYFDWVSVGAGA